MHSVMDLEKERDTKAIAPPPLPKVIKYKNTNVNYIVKNLLGI